MKHRGRCCLCCMSEEEQNRVKKLSGDMGLLKPNICVCVWRDLRFLNLLVACKPSDLTFGKACKHFA